MQKNIPCLGVYSIKSLKVVTHRIGLFFATPSSISPFLLTVKELIVLHVIVK